MPDLNITAILAAIFGGSIVGGLVKLWDTYIRSDQQEHAQAMDLVHTVREDIVALQKRQDKVERDLAEARRAKAQLYAHVQLMIERVDTLLDRLQQYEDISKAERNRYTDMPDVSAYPDI